MRLLPSPASVALASLVAIGSGGFAHASQNPAADSAAFAELGAGFTSGTAKTNDTTLHFVKGGTGPALLLVHGFPQDWSAWRHVMPSLATQFTVIAVDLRGIGGSHPTDEGYDGLSLATDLRALAAELELERPFIVGHDIGGMVVYAFARAYPRDTRGVMILEFPLPGLGPWAQVEREPALWHFAFHQTPKLPEALVAGRQAIYIRDFLDRIGGNPKLFSDEDIARFARAYESPGSLRAGFEFYRAFPQTEEWNAAQTEPVSVPIVLAAADRAVGPLLEEMATDIRQKGASNVVTEIIADSGHWVVDERPEQVIALIARYAAP